jgi:hypothetical protein
MILALYDIDVHYLYPKPWKHADPSERREILDRKYIKEYYHRLYYLTKDGYCFNYLFMFEEIVLCFFVSCFIFVVSSYTCQEWIIGENGYSSDLWVLSYTVFYSVIIGVNVLIMQRTHQISWLVVGGMVFSSIGPFFLFAVIWDLPAFRDFNISQGTLWFLIDKPVFWLTVLVNSFFVVAFEMTWQLVRIEMFPKLIDYFKILIKIGEDANPKYFESVKHQSWDRSLLYNLGNKVQPSDHEFGENIWEAAEYINESQKSTGKEKKIKARPGLSVSINLKSP